MTVTVIMPTYNRPEYLEASLASVLNQTRPPDQVIVVDDGSDHPEAVQDIVNRQDTRVQLVRLDENRGKAAALNQALPHATGDLVWIFDDDDLALYDRLEQVLPLFEADPDLDVVHTDAEWLSEDGQRRPWKAPDIPPGKTLRHQLAGNVWFSISVVWKRSLLERLAALEAPFADVTSDWPFDVRLERAQDYDFWIRLAWAGAKVAALHQVTVLARNHTGHRGIGHRLTPEQVPIHTQMAEQVIFQKVFQRIPFTAFFPDPEARYAGRVERAYAMFQRSLLVEALQDLEQVPATKPAAGSLSAAHRQALEAMGQAMQALRSKATLENLQVLEGNPDTPEFQSAARARIRTIRTQAKKLSRQVERLLAAAAPSGADQAVREMAQTLMKGDGNGQHAH